MSAWLILILIMSTGCAALMPQDDLRRELAASKDEAILLTKQRDQCLERNDKLEEDLRKKPRTITIRVPIPVKEIDPEELKEIKRQAFEEADRKFRIRVDQEKRKHGNQ